MTNIFFMKFNILKLTFSLFIVLVAASCRNFTPSDRNAEVIPVDTIGKADITFSEKEHSFGKINEGERVAYIFTFTNSGDADLIVSSVYSTCGCTVPKYDKKPIPPGGKGKLEVDYDSSGREGLQTKTITVVSNSEKNKVVILRITADVINK